MVFAGVCFAGMLGFIAMVLWLFGFELNRALACCSHSSPSCIGVRILLLLVMLVGGQFDTFVACMGHAYHRHALSDA